MIIDHTRCTHDTDARSRGLCRAKRQEIRDELAKTIEWYMNAGDISAWNGMEPKTVAEFMMSNVDTLATFQTNSALAAIRG